MRRFFAVFLWCYCHLIFSAHAECGESFVGVEALAVPHELFPSELFPILYNDVKRPALSTLWRTFGVHYEHMKDYTDAVSDRPHLLELYWKNFVCVHSRYCQPNELYYRWSEKRWKDELKHPSKKFRIRVRQDVLRLLQAVELVKNENTIPLLMIGLEDYLSPQEAHSTSRMMRSFGWQYAIGRNGMNTARDGIKYHEIHASDQLPTTLTGIVTLDGVTVSDPVEWMKRMLSVHPFAVELWEPKMQGIFDSDWRSVPPLRREIEWTGVDAHRTNQQLLTAEGCK